MAQETRWLERIVRAKRIEVEQARARTPQSVLEARVLPRSSGAFRQPLLARSEGRPDLLIIAEIKRASPSRGTICEHFDPAAIARGYERSGARALSVLTDREFFHGSLEHLQQAKGATSLPVLRKDFTMDDYQVYEAAVAGADAVLLIVAILEPQQLSRLLALSRAVGLDALVEVHTEKELQIALDAGSDLVGVNNRDLRTFEVSLDTSFRLIDRVPDAVVAVSESGLRTAEDLERLRAAGFDAFLIGERFMSEPDPGAALGRLLAEAAARAAVR